MHKEIGGYMELELHPGKQKYDALYKFNLGRTAFAFLLRHINPARVFIPKYICDSVPKSARSAGFEVVDYDIDEDLHPVWSDAAPSSEDLLYLVSYYGQLTTEDIHSYHEDYPLLLVDNAQAFYDAPVVENGIYTLYTARKYFGVSDGAYIASPDSLDYDGLETDISGDRIRYLAGRLEESARAYYGDMHSVSDTFSDAVPKKMSPLTERLLGGIDYEFVRNARRTNYETLSKLLPSDNPFTKHMPSCPFAYPYYHENGIELRKYLAEHSIFVPTNWSYLLKENPAGSLLHEWSANILPLPVDQRYSEEDMRTIAKAIKEF